MRIGALRAIIGLLAALALVATFGCDGEGLKFSEPPPDSGDQPGGGDDDDTPPPPPPDPVTDTRFRGDWIASYADDRVGESARYGRIEYAVKLSLRQEEGRLTGTGKMFRVFREGPTASDAIAVKVSGTTSGDDASFVISPNRTGDIDFNTTWYLRMAGNRLVGMYAAFDTSNRLVRSGHATWRKVTTSDAIGRDPWVAAFTDDLGGGGYPRRSRAAALTVSAADDRSLSGAGSFVELRDADASLALEYNVTRGGITGNEVGFSFGGLDLTGNEMDWFGFMSGGQISAVYGQYDASNQLVRYGHTQWLAAPAQNPSAITRLWITSFRDQRAAPGLQPSDYVMVLDAAAGANGAVTGTAQVLDEQNEKPAYLTYQIEKGNILGSRVQLELTRGGSANTRFVWDLRIAGTVLVGAYQQLDSRDRFVSGGHAEWRPATIGTNKGTWAVAYVDTYGAIAPEQTQLALVTITGEDTDGGMTGTGALRFAGETRRRLFNVQGTTESSRIRWVWRGADLFGDTVWHLRRAGNFMYGTYTNYTAQGALESRGSGVWLRTSQSSAFAQ